MKYLRLTDHNGIVTLVQQVFVEGPDFEWESPEPVAMWFGKIELVDKLPSMWEDTELIELQEVVHEKELKEVQSVEPKPVITESSGDTGASSHYEPESAEVSSENGNGRHTSKRDKRDKGRKKT